MGESHADIVRALFERFASGGVEQALELLADDFVLIVPPSMSAEPDAYEGHAGARQYFEAFDGLIVDQTFEALQIEEERGLVIAWMRFGGRGLTSGIEVAQHAAVLCRLEGGKVVRMEPHPDMETARDVARGW